jgi:hypothetical protein
MRILLFLFFAGAAGAQAPSSYQPFASLADIMAGILFPFSNTVFDVTKHAPKNDMECGSNQRRGSGRNRKLDPGPRPPEREWPTSPADGRFQKACPDFSGSSQGRLQSGADQECGRRVHRVRAALSSLLYLPRGIPLLSHLPGSTAVPTGPQAVIYFGGCFRLL